MLRYFSRAMTTITRSIHTPMHTRPVKAVNVRIDDSVPYPTLGDGLYYNKQIFDIQWTYENILKLQSYIWNEESFMPTTPCGLLHDTPFKIFAEVGQRMPYKDREGGLGLLGHNKFREEVNKVICPKKDELFNSFMTILRMFQKSPTFHLAQLISDVGVWVQWLMRGYLFEGKLHGEFYCHPMIPAPLSTIGFAANAAMGRHQIEFVYDDYANKSGCIPLDRSFEDMNYDNPNEVLDFIANIHTNVGFCDMSGYNPEHNFRFNHTGMELQMSQAFRGWKAISADHSTADQVIQGWKDVAQAAERAHKVFKTMMTGTPVDSYPLVRLIIKGTREGCGTVFDEHGVFYEDCGPDAFTYDGRKMSGCFVDREFGETGANSSMFKWFDILSGTAKERSAYNLNPAKIEKLRGIYTNDEDPGDLGDNPIDSMQRAFEAFTVPTIHLNVLARDNRRAEELNLQEHDQDPKLADCWETVAFQRLKLLFWVASHRHVHGMYVYKMIYSTTPLGGQSRAIGTGGSTPPFLKLFHDQTYKPFLELTEKLKNAGRPEMITAEMQADMNKMVRDMRRQSEEMGKVQKKGLELQDEEKEIMTNADMKREHNFLNPDVTKFWFK